MRNIFIICFALSLTDIACNSRDSAVTASRGTQTSAPELPELPEQKTAKSNPYAARRIEKGYFDLLSAPVAPGESTTQRARLPNGWKVTGVPKLATDPVTGEIASFVIENSTTEHTKEADFFVVVARNTGRAPARLVADVPCAGCQ